MSSVVYEQGNYSLTNILCNQGTVTGLQTIAFINNEYRYSPATVVNAGNNIYNAHLCDTMPGIADNFVARFPIPPLNSVIRDMIGNPAEPLLYAQVKNIDMISISSTVINNISVPEYCTNLAGLYPGYGNFSDLRPLKNLKT